jgi:hypothetical protein
MLQKIGCSLLCAGALFSAQALAMNYSLTPGMNLKYALPPKEPLKFTNFLLWTIKATCTISSEDQSDDLYAKLNNKGKISEINGQPVSHGNTLLMTVHPEDKFVIIAESGAEVELKNLGAHTIFVNCSAMFG